jgi:hypothetical protein
MSNPGLKARRARSWKNGEKKKILNRQAQQAQENKNKTLPPESRPWAIACEKRRQERKPLQAAWNRQHAQDVLSAS